MKATFCLYIIIVLLFYLFLFINLNKCSLLDSPEAVQMLSKGDIVYITSFVDLQTVYVRRINNGTDKFKSFLENFSSRCALGK